MPLVKNARITTDPFVHVADGAELPGDGDILVSSQRFLADPEALLHRPGKTGVIWPNNRSVDDLVPYLDRVAAVGEDQAPGLDGRMMRRTDNAVVVAAAVEVHRSALIPASARSCPARRKRLSSGERRGARAA